MATPSGSTFGGAFVSGQAPPSSLASSISAFGNPFAAASSNVLASATTAATSGQIGSKEDKNSMMAAFSDMGLELEASSSAAAAAASSAKALLAKKIQERQEEEQAEALHLARRQARQAAKQHEKKSAPVSALMQAIDAFAGEVSQSDSFSSTLSRKNAASAGAFSAGSRRAQRKQDKSGGAKDRGGKSVRDVKRHQRRETYRNL